MMMAQNTKSRRKLVYTDLVLSGCVVILKIFLLRFVV